MIVAHNLNTVSLAGDTLWTQGDYELLLSFVKTFTDRRKMFHRVQCCPDVGMVRKPKIVIAVPSDTCLMASWLTAFSKIRHVSRSGL